MTKGLTLQTKTTTFGMKFELNPKHLIKINGIHKQNTFFFLINCHQRLKTNLNLAISICGEQKYYISVFQIYVLIGSQTSTVNLSSEWLNQNTLAYVCFIRNTCTKANAKTNETGTHFAIHRRISQFQTFNYVENSIRNPPKSAAFAHFTLENMRH